MKLVCFLLFHFVSPYFRINGIRTGCTEDKKVIRGVHLIYKYKPLSWDGKMGNVQDLEVTLIVLISRFMNFLKKMEHVFPLFSHTYQPGISISNLGKFPHGLLTVSAKCVLLPSSPVL